MSDEYLQDAAGLGPDAPGPPDDAAEPHVPDATGEPRELDRLLQAMTAQEAANAHEPHEHHEPTRRRGLELIEIVALALLAVALAVGLYLVWGRIADRPTLVPKVTGLKQADAGRLVTEAGLEVGDVGFEPRDVDEVAPGIVLSQKPEMGTEVPRGTRVHLVVASKPIEVEIPDVVGTTRKEGVGVLQGIGLTVQVTEQYSSTQPSGRILAQVPKAGRQITTADPVLVVVSLGDGEGGVVVPDVKGTLYTQAAPKLADAGLIAKPFYENVVDSPQGTVVSQRPKAGTRVREGSTIALTVSAFPAEP